MNFNHEKYPIIVGAIYVNEKLGEEGVLDSCVLYRRRRNDAEIIIDVNFHGRAIQVELCDVLF